MRFIYSYKTSQGEFCEGEVSASSRDAAFALLKKNGIRPMKVSLAPGLWNGVLSLGKRGAAIVVLSVALTAVIVLLLRMRREPQAEPRSQIYGDPAVLQECARNGWRNVLSEEGDLILARYAQPGQGVPSDVGDRAGWASALERSLATRLTVTGDGLQEHRKMKRIVNGMKDELREYLRDGGSVETYLIRLDERQRTEIGIRESVKEELSKVQKKGSGYEQVWDEKNRLLREMGMRTIPLPEEPYSPPGGR